MTSRAKHYIVGSGLDREINKIECYTATMECKEVISIYRRLSFYVETNPQDTDVAMIYDHCKQLIKGLARDVQYTGDKTFLDPYYVREALEIIYNYRIFQFEMRTSRE